MENLLKGLAFVIGTVGGFFSLVWIWACAGDGLVFNGLTFVQDQDDPRGIWGVGGLAIAGILLLYAFWDDFKHYGTGMPMDYKK